MHDFASLIISIRHKARSIADIAAVIALLAVSAGLGAAGLETMLSKGGPGPIGAFGKGSMVAILILNAFILTTLDTATRICRYLSEELFKIKNRFFSTAVVVFTSGALALSGKWTEIWPMFGASNQLVAALTFVVISSWLLCKGKSQRFAFFPAIFMLVTSVGALLYQLTNFIRNGEVVLAIMSIVLIIMAGTMMYDVLSTIKRRGLKCKIL